MNIAGSGDRIDVVVVTAEGFEKVEPFGNARAVQQAVECLLDFLHIPGAELDDTLHDGLGGFDHLPMQFLQGGGQGPDAIEARIANGPPPPEARPLWPQPSTAQRAASAPPVRDPALVDHKVLIVKNLPYEMTTVAHKEIGGQILSHLPDDLSQDAKAASR